MGRNIIIFFILVCLTATLSAQPIRHRYPPPVKFSKNLNFKIQPHQMYATGGNTSSGVAWGPIVKVSTDALGSGGNYSPHLAVRGDTVHCTWFMDGPGCLSVPYARSTDGFNWENPKDLLTDSSGLPRVSTGGTVIISHGMNVYVFFVGALDSGGQLGKVYFIKSSDRGESWSMPFRATSDTMGALWSASVNNDTMACIYVPDVNDLAQWPRITRSTNAGMSWTKNPIDMPSTASNQLRVALTPGLLNVFHVGQRWFPNPEIVLQRSRDLADSWIDSIALSPIDGNGSDMPEVTSYERFGTGDPTERTTLGVMWRGEEFTSAWFSAGIALRLSYNNGNTWQPMQIVSDTPRGSFHALDINENMVAVSWQDEMSDFGPFRVKARISDDCGETWYSTYNLTPTASHAGVPVIALSSSAVHIAWEELIDGKWNIYYRRGELLQIVPSISPSFLDFDTLAVGCSRSRSVTVRNLRCDPLYLTSHVTNEQDFSITPDLAIIPSHDSVALSIRFAPLSVGDKSTQIILIHNQSVEPDTIMISAATMGTGSETVVKDSFGIGWQLISLPLDPHCPYILPGSFLYQGSYFSTETLLVRRGYWNKLNNPKLTFAGTVVLDDTISVTAQWNTIGSISSPVDVRSIQSIPAGVFTSNFYGYNGTNYFAVDTIYPGRGYWVKVIQDAVFILSTSSSVQSVNSVNIIHTAEMPPPPPEIEISNPNPTKSVQTPSEFALEQNYPNPFNPSTKISFKLQVSGFTSLKVYDVFGREVATIVHEQLAAGGHEVEWNPSSSSGQVLASGVYLYRLQTQMFTETKKLILIR